MANDTTLARVDEIMTRDVITVSADESMHDTIRVMVSKGIRHLPVLKHGTLVAVISDRDLRVMVTDIVDDQARMDYLRRTPVMDHATHPVNTTTADTPITDAAKTFVEQRIGCLPVVDANDHLVGIITQTDLLKWMASMAGTYR